MGTVGLRSREKFKPEQRLYKSIMYAWYGLRESVILEKNWRFQSRFL